jgi:hypothetical protein
VRLQKTNKKSVNTYQVSIPGLVQPELERSSLDLWPMSTSLCYLVLVADQPTGQTIVKLGEIGFGLNMFHFQIRWKLDWASNVL